MRNATTRLGFLGLAALAAATLVACQGGDAGKAALDAFQISPTSSHVAPGDTLKFQVLTVAGAGPVRWAVQESNGGTVDAEGNYTAPGAEGTYHVTATPRDGALWALAEIHVGVRQTLGVTISPAGATVLAGATLTFAARVYGVTTSAVTWSLTEDPGAGSITPEGVYTAPQHAGTFHVVGRSAADQSQSGQATIVVGDASAPPPPTPIPTPNPTPNPGPGSSPSTGTGASHAPSYLPTVTGGGSMPSTNGAPVASCAGDGTTDDTSCLQNAITSAAHAGQPLAIPATASYYRITAPLTVTTSLIGSNGTPTIKQTATCATSQCVTLRLAQDLTGWIYNLHLAGAYVPGSTPGGEYAHLISIGGVNGVTIKGNLLENPNGDSISDNAQENDARAARNVLIDGNTFTNWYRCMISMVNVADSWAIMNNTASNVGAYVSPIDLEPWRDAAYVTNIEVGYNKIVTPANPAQTQAGNYNAVVAATGWFDPTPGGNVYVHHNYGSWPFAKFEANVNNAGTFSNVVDVSNVQGNSPAP